MIKYILYQNSKEYDRIKEYLQKTVNNLFEDIIYFKSHIYENTKYNYNDINTKYYDIYKNIYKNKLNQNQLNHLLSIKKILEDSIDKNMIVL